MTDAKQVPWTLDVAKLRCIAVHTEDDQRPAVRISGFLFADEGISVDVPIREFTTITDLQQRAAILAADLDNAFNTMVWLATDPLAALRTGDITEAQATAILSMMQRLRATT